MIIIKASMNLLNKIIWGIAVVLTINMADANELNLSITGIDLKRGGNKSNVVVYIFTSPRGYPKIHKEADFKQIQKANQTKLNFRIAIPKHIKELSIKVHHDLNGDGKVTKNWTGIIPKDGLGFSNKQKLSLRGVHKFNHSRLTQAQFLKKQTITLQYYSN